MAGKGSSINAIMYAFLANLGIAIAKGTAAFFTGSGSMLAEAIHSLADCANQTLLFLGLKRAARPPTEEHPLGYGKVIYFWSFIVAVLLFSMGGLFSIYEGIHKIRTPEPLKQAWVALVVLGVSIILEGFSLAGALREIKAIRGSQSLREWLKTSRNAELVVVLGEDIAALLGLVVAFAFVLLAMLTANPLYDAVGSIFIGVILIVVSVFVAMRVKSLLIGRSAAPDIQALIEKEIAANENIEKVFHVITLQFGPDIVLAAKIKLKGSLEISAACSIINRLESKIKEQVPEIKWCFIEPDISD